MLNKNQIETMRRAIKKYMRGVMLPETLDQSADAICDMALAHLEAEQKVQAIEMERNESCSKCGIMPQKYSDLVRYCKCCNPASLEAAPSGEALDLHKLRETGNGVCPHAYALCPHCQPPASQGGEALRDAAEYFRDRCLPHPETPEWLQHSAALSPSVNKESNREAD